MMEKKDKSKLMPAFRALADTTRLKILLMLESKPRTVGEIVAFFDLSQPTITRHLQSLLKAGLVIRKKQAQKVYYQLNADSIKSFCVELVACFPCCSVSVSPSRKLASKQFFVTEAAECKTPRPKSRSRKKQGE